MIGLYRDLEKRAQTGNPIQFAVIGAGQMGTDIVSQTQMMQGIQVRAVADLEIERARRAYRVAGVTEDRLVEAANTSQANDAARAGKFVVTDRPELIGQIEAVESVVDATGNPEAGAQIALWCFEQRKHLLMMNVEADVTIGPALRRRADRAGVIYTLAAGDEPTALMELYSFARALGLEVVAAGKGKNNPLDREATPEKIEAEARRRDLNPMMLVEFVDGSKTMIEMACFANATGLVPDVPNMHGPRTSIPELKNVFRLRQDGGILNRKGVVDYAVGAVAPGVFLTVTTEQRRLQQCLFLRDMGPGPVYQLFRPYHLCSIEVPLTAALVSLWGRPTMQPLDSLSTEVTTIAKKDLRPGEFLEGIGGRTHHAGCMVYSEARAQDLLPIGLAKGCKVLQPIHKGSLISTRTVDPPRENLIYKLRLEQDRYSG